MQVWEWPDSKWKRPKLTVADHVYWSYAWLIATRIAQRQGQPVGHRRRNYMAVPNFYKLLRGEKTLSSLERDLFQSFLVSPACMHCGSGLELTMDHLIPRSRGGGADAENIVTCCKHCNSARGNLDLMIWYRRRSQFPTLVLMRQYLKLCHKYASTLQLLDVEVGEAQRRGLPFEPRAC
ncbi:HNH endonuclease [Ruixingdingia sedimenti]|uniref:HNH endonuclease signature motif containing protein n=1 Tax=Ruixingdingia sedimenti TaxID=3073604 RepID=A0ABU1FE52_9RHOB|nr:HNH endonuclease signature motif containing protein [Xinfangfangia sp. LG-4]MDR5655147.1 HNH endonuclease signature motif containing protein [Xinfangfangia sp. LG-4]